VGSSKQLQITITNNSGTFQLFEFSKFKGATAAFIFGGQPPPFTINVATGSSFPRPITFAPTKKGRQQATFVVKVGNTKKTITLTGKGVPEA
jgi:hypothetical protein